MNEIISTEKKKIHHGDDEDIQLADLVVLMCMISTLQRWSWLEDQEYDKIKPSYHCVACLQCMILLTMQLNHEL